ncbi:MAG: DNA primase [Firmicutes bacterium]|nr:DNA primase [Bacillota bacterium]
MSGLIPPEIIEEIIERNDIVEVIGEYVPLKKRGRNYFGLCPFHQEDTESFAVNQDKRFYNCFGCGKGGNVIGFVRDIEGITFPEAARKLAERAGIRIPENELSPAARQNLELRRQMLDANQAAKAFYQQALWAGNQNSGQAYLQKRGLSPEICKRFSLGYAAESQWQALYDHLKTKFGESVLTQVGLISKSAKNGRYYDKFHGRLMFPICDYQGRTIAFGGRTLTGDAAKYLNSMNTPLFNKSQVLYGLDIAAPAVRQSRQIFIMEGYMDVIAAHQFGISNAVATLGTAFTEAHSRLLKRYAPEPPQKLMVYLAFDGDQAGAKAAGGGLNKLRNLDYIDVRILVLPPGQDPDDFIRAQGPEGWRDLVARSAYPILDYLLRQALEHHDIEHAGGKSGLVAELLPAIAATGSDVERNGFIRQLAQILQVDAESIYADLRRSGLRIRMPREQAVHPAALKEPVIHKAGYFLLRLAIENRKVFTEALADLEEGFANVPEGMRLISLIKELADEYDFQPATLFNHIDANGEGLRKFLLKLLQADLPEGDPEQLAAEAIKGMKLSLLLEQKERLRQELNAALAAKEDVKDLLLQQMALDKRLENLKG